LQTELDICMLFDDNEYDTTYMCGYYGWIE